MAITFDLESLQLNRLLRRKTVDLIIFIIKCIIIGIIAVLFILLVHSVVNSLLSASSSIGQLEEDIATLDANVAPAAKPLRKKRDYSVITENKIFGELGAKQAAQPAVAKAVTPLNLELIGTFVSTGQAPYAIIEEKKKRTQDVFNLSDSVFGEATLTAIYNDRVEILRNGNTEVLRLDNTPDSTIDTPNGVGQVGENQFVVEEEELDKALENLPLLLTQARAVPYFKEGKAVGLRMFAIRSGSLFEKIGLKNGDILKSINANSLGDLSQAMKLFERLKQERNISLVLERNNEEKEFSYQIK